MIEGVTVREQGWLQSMWLCTVTVPDIAVNDKFNRATFLLLLLHALQVEDLQPVRAKVMLDLQRVFLPLLRCWLCSGVMSITNITKIVDRHGKTINKDNYVKSA